MATNPAPQTPPLNSRLQELKQRVGTYKPQELRISLEPPHLGERAQLEGSILSHMQKDLIRYDIATIGTQLLNLTLDPQNPTDFAQQHAFLKGQLDWLSYMLERSDASEAALRNPANQSTL